MASRVKHVSGDSIGDMTFISDAGSVLVGIRKQKQRMAIFECRCGNTITTRIADVKAGKVFSCGCQRGKKPTHGLYRSGNTDVTYRTWVNIIKRCSEQYPGHHFYYDRGIKVCDRWLESFDNFLADMGSRPHGKYSIDRIDVNGNYEPSNCRWATLLQQANNRRDNVSIEYNGDIHTIAEWGRILDIPPKTLGDRLKRWSIERSLTEPVNKK